MLQCSYLLDRLTRYSKIGGEMVPHLAVEEVLLQGLEATGQVVYVTSAPDEKKGEAIALLSAIASDTIQQETVDLLARMLPSESDAGTRRAMVELLGDQLPARPELREVLLNLQRTERSPPIRRLLLRLLRRP